MKGWGYILPSSNH